VLALRGMMKLARRLSRLLTFAAVLAPSLLHAQPPAAPAPAPAPPPPLWTGNAGFGLSLNRGNTSTTNFNAAFEASRDPKTDSVWKFKGLYLRGETAGDLTVDRLLLDGRNERTFATRAYAFVQAQFLEDEFKEIDWLFAPSGGLGYKLIATPKTSLNADAGLGVKFEQNHGFERRTDAVVTSGEKFEYKLSPTATITQSFGSLWKAKDFGDALYTFTTGVAAALTTRTQLKFELLDTYATQPPNVEVKKNDVALITALVYKF
jgi:putative salt-induced outer membrane protein YdiY